MKLPVSGRILCALLALSGVVAAPIARAQAWPERPITLLMLAAQMVARAKPDGYTLLVTTGANMITGPMLAKSPIFDPEKDVTPVALLSVNPLVLVASKASGITSLSALIAQAKARPGQIAIGSYGVGTPPHLAIELMKMRFGIDVIHVPYNGSNPAMIDLRGGRIPVLMDFLPSQVRTITDGEVVGLAIGQKTHSTRPAWRAWRSRHSLALPPRSARRPPSSSASAKRRAARLKTRHFGNLQKRAGSLSCTRTRRLSPRR